MMKLFAATLPLLVANVEISANVSATEVAEKVSSGGCGGGERGPQGPAGPRGPQGEPGTPGQNGYTAVGFQEGGFVTVSQGSLASPANLVSVTVTSAEQGKALVHATGHCTLTIGGLDNTATLAIRTGGDTSPLMNPSEGIQLSAPRTGVSTDNAVRSSFSIQRLMDVNAGVPATFTVYAGRGNMDPSLGSNTVCKAQVSALFVKTTF